MSLVAADRERLEELVRPLYRGLDGADGWSRVRRLEAVAGRLGESADATTVELLALLHGVADRLGGGKPSGRLRLFLQGLETPGVDPGAIVRSLARWREEPESEAEKAVHDAVLLETSGLEATLDRLLHAGRKRLSLERALGRLESGARPDRFKTERGRAVARERRQRVEEWLRTLEEQLAAERSEL